MLEALRAELELVQFRAEAYPITNRDDQAHIIGRQHILAHPEPQPRPRCGEFVQIDDQEGPSPQGTEENALAPVLFLGGEQTVELGRPGGLDPAIGDRKMVEWQPDPQPAFAALGKCHQSEDQAQHQEQAGADQD